MRAADFRIGVYVLAKNAKQTYATESYDVRINAGMAVVCDILERAGYTKRLLLCVARRLKNTSMSNASSHGSLRLNCQRATS